MNNVTTPVCKTLKSLGILDRTKTLSLVNQIQYLVKHNGIEFVLSRLSSLMDWRKQHMAGNSTYTVPWFRQRDFKPKDRIGALLWSFPDKTFFSVCGALRKSVTLSQISSKQAAKWLSAVRFPYGGTLSSQIMTPSLFTKEQQKSILHLLQSKTRQNWQRHHYFGISDVTGSSVPTLAWGLSYFNGKHKKDPLAIYETRRYSPKELAWFLEGYLGTIASVPPQGWRYYLNSINLTKAFSHNPQKIPTGNRKKRDGSFYAPLEQYAEIFAGRPSHRIGGNFDLIRTRERTGMFFRRETGHSYRINNHRLVDNIDAPIVGSIGVIQERAGKLRTVANPNRFLQYLTLPFGMALHDFALTFKGNFMMNQDAGKKWAQDQLTRGQCLSSFDLSSATDTLDYRSFFKELFKGITNDRIQTYYPDLRRAVDFFCEISSGQWRLPLALATKIGEPQQRLVQWSSGQPLGLRPSFPLLAIMNCSIAEAAIRDSLVEYITNRTGLHISMWPDQHYRMMMDEVRSSYACVGDDLIIKSEYADKYVEYMKAYSGQISKEKGMTSDKYAEFCSTLITPSDMYPLKPSFHTTLDGSFENLHRFSVKGLRPKAPRWVREIYHKVASINIQGISRSRFSNTPSPKKFIDRVSYLLSHEVAARPQMAFNEYSLSSILERSYPDEVTQSLNFGLTKIDWPLTQWIDGYCRSEFTGHSDRIRKLCKEFEVSLGLNEFDAFTSVKVIGNSRVWDKGTHKYVTEQCSSLSLMKSIALTYDRTEPLRELDSINCTGFRARLSPTEYVDVVFPKDLRTIDDDFLNHILVDYTRVDPKSLTLKEGSKEERSFAFPSMEAMAKKFFSSHKEILESIARSKDGRSR